MELIAIMLDVNLLTATEMQAQIATRAKEARLHCNMSQQELASRSGVSLSSLKRFEHTTEISLHSLLQIAFVLGELTPFAELFPKALPPSLFAKKVKERKRSGRGPSQIRY